MSNAGQAGHPIRRRIAALLGILAAGCGLALLLAAPASAHATVVTSTPDDGSRLNSAPAVVTITFDESVGLSGIGYLHVTDQSGKRVDAAAATHPDGDASKVSDRLVGGLGDGTYTASFRVVSADSHPVAGTIRFVVGNGALARGSVQTTATNTTTGAAFDVVRWISYAGFAVLGGAWLLFTVWPAGREDRRAMRIVWTGWAGVAVGAGLELLLQGPYSAGERVTRIVDGSLLDSTLHSDYGQLHSVRLILLGLLAAALVTGLRATSRWWAAASAALMVGVAYTFSAAGHADTTGPNWISIPLDMLHLLAMATWLGGLAVLVVALLPRRDSGELRGVLPVFSTAAFVSVVVLAGSGTYAAWRGIGTVHAILTTTYGLLVVGKIVLFVGLLALGNLSRGLVRRRYHRPQLAYAMSDIVLDEPAVAEDEDGDDDPISTERLRRSVLVETGVALIVLALTAVLVAEPRGKEALVAQYRDPVTATAALGGGRSVTVTSDPGTHGAVQFTVSLSAGRGPTAITATATQNAAQIGPIPVRLTKAGGLVYDGSASLPVAGRWEIDLVVTTSAFDATTTDVTLQLH